MDWAGGTKGERSMKFHLGAVPEAADFYPDVDGWSSIREPGPILMQVIAIPVAFLLLILLSVLFVLAVPGQFHDHRIMTLTFPLVPMVIILVLLIPVHELIHAFCTPHMGMTERTLIGIWPSRLLCYAYYEGSMSRNRFLVTFLGPFVVLSLFPIAIVALGRFVPISFELVSDLIFLSMVNGAAASGDFIGFVLVLLQIPPNAQVRNLGWRTFWKLTTLTTVLSESTE